MARPLKKTPAKKPKPPPKDAPQPLLEKFKRRVPPESAALLISFDEKAGLKVAIIPPVPGTKSANETMSLLAYLVDQIKVLMGDPNEEAQSQEADTQSDPAAESPVE